MHHPYYKHPEKFKPKSSSVESWLKTRKNNSENKPGIFETVDFRRDQYWAIASIFVEIAAFYFTLQGAYKTYLAKGDITTMIIASVIVMLFVVFDIFGIMLHGQDKPMRVKNKSLFLITSNPSKKKELYLKQKQTTWREFLGFLLLFISALLKIFALWYYFQSNVQILIVFTILYTVVIYIHAAHTVYWWPALFLSKSIKKQYLIFDEFSRKGVPTPEENTVTDDYSVDFSSQKNLEEKQIKISNRISVVNKGEHLYTLTSKGILWDEDITLLVSQWGGDYQDDLIKACIKLQLLQVGVIADGEGYTDDLKNPVYAS